MKLEDYIGKKVNIECTDGKNYDNYYVSDFGIQRRTAML